MFYKPPEQFVKHLRDNENKNDIDDNGDIEAGEDFLKPVESIVNKDYYGGDVDI